MGRRQTGLTKRGRVWYIDKQIKGYGRLYESTRTADRDVAEDYLAARVAEIRKGIIHGVQLDRTFAEAAAKYLNEVSHINTIDETIRCTDWLVSELGAMRLAHITPAVTDELVSKRQRMGNTNATVNRMMEKLRAILVKAVSWQWMASAPKIRMLPEPQRRVRWLTRAEADRLLAELPPHLRAMAQFTLATGLRESNVTGLEWSQVDLERRIAWIHPDQSKNNRAISVPLNADAVVVLRAEQGKHDRWVFTYRGVPRKEVERVLRCNNTAWRKALKRAGIENFRWHDLRHTWASWHVMAGTPLHVLQQLGGWSSYEMVLRYAHLSAEHLAAYADALSKPREMQTHVKSHVSQ